jgi:hypothetical protein
MYWVASKHSTFELAEESSDGKVESGLGYIEENPEPK